MQRQQLINWISNIIKSKITQEGKTKYELESKVGRFIGKNTHSKKALEDVDFEQLDKSQLNYEFQSRVTEQQHNSALEFLKQMGECSFMTRLDFNFNKKEQRSSLFIQDEKSSAILIEKKKKLTQHIDIANKKLHYRVSLNQETVLSESLKDILSQMPSREKNIALIRIKQTHFCIKDKLEYSLSSVYQIHKHQPEFQQIIHKVLLAKSFNIKQIIEEIIESLTVPKEHELEVEIINDNITEDQQIEIATRLIAQTEALAEHIQLEQINKKVKI